MSFSTTWLKSLSIHARYVHFCSRINFPLTFMRACFPLKYILSGLQVWLRKIQSLLKRNSDGVQSVVERALKILPRHKHIKFISQTAILEFKCGSPERARSLFESMLREYPKRTDLWSVYIDQVILSTHFSSTHKIVHCVCIAVGFPCNTC